MVVKNTHTPAAAAMQACVTHSTCVADFVLYTSAPDRGEEKYAGGLGACVLRQNISHMLYLLTNPWAHELADPVENVFTEQFE